MGFRPDAATLWHHGRVRCNAVFKGGGAKGIAYVGALEACERAGVEFAAVAGSSAGAITAALVSAGFKAADLAELTRTALQTVGSPVAAIARLDRSSLLSSDGLRDWLEHTIAEQIRGPGRAGSDLGGQDSPCTFEELFNHRSIELYVVAMDLASRQPIVFSHELTPTMSVTDAVIASSAIPVAFPAVLVEVDGEVRRLVDGGAYANYPSFVFDDPTFRSHHDLAPAAPTTLGFIVDQSPEERPSTSGSLRAFRAGRADSDRGSAVREMGPVGALLTAPVLRWSLIGVPFLFLLVAMLWLVAEAARGYPVMGRLPPAMDPLEDIGLLVVALIMAMAWVVVIPASLLLARLGRDLLDVGVMGATAAMGVGPNVPYWIGETADGQTEHVAVRIPVPEALGTLSFKAPDHLIDEAITVGRETTGRRLGEVFGLPHESASTPAPQVADPTDDTTTDNRVPSLARRMGARFVPDLLWRRRRAGASLGRAVGRAIGSILAVYFGGIIVGLLALGALSYVVRGRVVLAVLMFTVAGLAAFVGAIALVARKANTALDPYPILRRFSPTMLSITAIIGVVLAGSTIASGLSTGRFSIPTLALTQSTPVTILDVDERTIPAVPLVTVTFDELDAETVGSLTVDHRGTEVARCDGVPAPQRCVVFSTDNRDFVAGQLTTARYDPALGLVLLEDDLWSFGFLGGPLIIVTLAVAFLTVSYHALRAKRWKRRVAMQYDRVPPATAPPETTPR